MPSEAHSCWLRGGTRALLLLRPWQIVKSLFGSRHCWAQYCDRASVIIIVVVLDIHSFRGVLRLKH